MIKPDQIDRIREELSEWARKKAQDEGFPVATVALGLIESGFVLALTIGTSPTAITKAVPDLLVSSQKLATMARNAHGGMH